MLTLKFCSVIHHKTAYQDQLVCCKRNYSIPGRYDFSYYVEHAVRKDFWSPHFYAIFEMPTIKGVKK
tara:strand:+ start:327 stop:527 length:201 start_codon:yes stop_codon:yes gene_type:complete